MQSGISVHVGGCCLLRQMSLLSSGNTDDVSELFPPSVDTAEGLQDLFHRLDTITAFMEEHYDYQMVSYPMHSSP